LLCAAFALAASAWHLARNATPPSWDDAWYLETSFRLWTALRSGPLVFARAFEDALHIKAPLLALLPLPLYGLFGMGERVAVWVNLPLAAVSAWAWSRAASAWWKDHPRGADAAALGGALCALLPIGYGLSRVFFVETLVTALLGLWAWRCALAREADRREGLRLGVVLGLGLLAKVTFPLLALGFAWPARRRLRPHLTRGLIVAALIASTWYAANLPYVLGFAWSAGFGSVSRDYAGAGGWTGRLNWAISLARDGFSWPLFLAASAVAFASASSVREKRGEGLRAAAWGLAPFALFAVSSNHEIRLLAPLLPVFVLLAARAAVSFPSNAARTASAGLLLASGLGVCAGQTFGHGPALSFNGPPSPDAGWNRGALIDAVVRFGGGDAVAAVALEHRFLNANNLSALAAARGLKLSFVSLGYAQNSVEGALIRLKDKNASFLILVENLPEEDVPAFLNKANTGVAEALRSGRLSMRLLGRIPLKPGVVAELWGRI
jgi:4-amino-4-deoxy-L-arabinose transferase-like glycosyltransferase